MDQVFINILMKSELSDEFKANLLHLLKDYYDSAYGHISVGDAYDLVKDLLILESDLKNSSFNDETIRSFIYVYAKKCCYKTMRDKNTNEEIIVWEKMYNILIENSLFNYKARKYFLNLESPQSGIVDFIKDASILINELAILMKDNKRFLVLKKYHEILEFCNYQGINPKLLEPNNQEDLKEILEKRYSVYSQMRNPMFYKKEVNKRKLFKEDSSDIKEFNYIKTASTESYIIQKSLHKIMLDYYTQTKYFFKLYNRDTYIYHLDNIIVYAYKYDNTPNIALKSGKLTLTWEDRDFWAKIFDPNIDYIEGNDFNYFIDSEEKTELYRLLALNFQSTPVIKKEGINYIYAPINHIEEAIYKTLTKNNTIPLDQKIKNQMILYGFNFENIKEKLLTTDGSFYFKDPTIIDELEVENLEEHHYLNLLKSKKDKNSLNRSIASIISHSKKNPKKVVEEKKVKKYPEKKLKYRNYDNIRLPYKDN